MIQYQIFQTNITRTVWQTVRRIATEILGVQEIKVFSLLLIGCCLLCFWFLRYSITKCSTMKEKMEIKEKKHHEKGILHLCCQVISSGQMFESEQTIPMPSPSPARIVLDNLLNQLSVSTDSTLENVSFFWYRTQICLCSSLKHEGLLNHLYFPQRFGTCG